MPVADTSFDGAGSGEWEPVCELAAEVLDVLPSRSEKLADGINLAANPARVRMRYRSDITSAMRCLVLRWADGEWKIARTMQIVAGPAEIGHREGLEFMAEDYSVAGNAA